MTLLIETTQVSRYYGKQCVVDNISFSLQRGQVLGFLGPNGAGKTTTMQMLTGNLAPSIGSIRINNYDIVKHAQAAKRHLGYLPDTPPLYRELTVKEYLRYCAQLHQMRSPEIPAAIAKTITNCGLGPHQQRLIANLSKGMQQRVGIAQAILHNPDVIILDEPTVGLDPLQITEILGLIRELGQQHGIILSTHRLSEVQQICSHVQIINQGRLLLNESIEELNRVMDTDIIQIRTRLPADSALLASIPGVDSITRLSEQQIRIHYRVSTNPSNRITEIIMANGWDLLELTPVKKSMEEIFIQLIQDNSA